LTFGSRWTRALAALRFALEAAIHIRRSIEAVYTSCAHHGVSTITESTGLITLSTGTLVVISKVSISTVLSTGTIEVDEPFSITLGARISFTMDTFVTTFLTYIGN
jgi:hypothetical protein